MLLDYIPGYCNKFTSTYSRIFKLWNFIMIEIPHEWNR